MKFLQQKYWSPYIAVILIGLLQIPIFFLDASLGSSGSLQSFACIISNLFSINNMRGCLPNIKSWWQLGFVLGIIFGAWLSSHLSGYVRPHISLFWEKSIPNYNDKKRYFLAFIGGVLFVFGARLADGCTMGNGVSGIALLSVGSIVVITAMFTSGILAARFYKK